MAPRYPKRCRKLTGMPPILVTVSEALWKQRAVIGHFRDNWVYWTSSSYAGARQTVTWDSGGWGYAHGNTEIGNLPAARCVRKF